MNDYVLYFKDDQPKMIWFSKKRAPYNAEERNVDGYTFWVSNCTYKAAILNIIQKSTIEKDSEVLRKYEKILVDLIDVKRGDGFSILLESFDKWHELLDSNCETPDEYK